MLHAMGFPFINLMMSMPPPPPWLEEALLVLQERPELLSSGTQCSG